MAKMLRQIDDEAIEKPFNRSQFVRLMRYMMVYKKYMIGSILLMAVATVCSLGQPFLQSRAIGYLQDKGMLGYIPYLVGGMVLLGIANALCTRQRVRWMDTVGRKALKTLRQDLFDHIQTLSFSFFDTHSAGKILVRVINDVNELNDLFTNGIVNVLVQCFTVLLLLVIMFIVNWKLTLIGMC
ncbi:MAG: ABC transporter ATP-binding protein, partial [Clostridia bacterium]|nr:ABC transporter ATP-binding protein [Clostridia bacterium]